MPASPSCLALVPETWSGSHERTLAIPARRCSKMRRRLRDALRLTDTGGTPEYRWKAGLASALSGQQGVQVTEAEHTHVAAVGTLDPHPAVR